MEVSLCFVMTIFLLFPRIDELDEAIHITAESLGKDWAQLYQKLPFKPYRDFENRSRDIEGKLTQAGALSQCQDVLQISSLGRYGTIKRV